MNINKCYYIIFNKVSEEFDKNNYEDAYNLYINDIDFWKNKDEIKLYKENIGHCYFKKAWIEYENAELDSGFLKCNNFS